ncbi:MAG: TonB-dependent receptor [Oligoflexia bacterium]|nr:TonB-dependent receptor [Oligoflexia bacterium]
MLLYLYLLIFLIPNHCWSTTNTLEPIIVEGESIDESTTYQWDSRKQNGKIYLDQVKNLPSIDIQKSGGLGQPASLFYRGSKSGDTLIYLNDLLMNDPISTSGAVDFSSFPLIELDSITQINGPESLTFEKSSIGTILNLNTKKNSALNSSITLGYPLYRSVSVAHDGFFLSAHESKQISAADQREENLELDPYKTITFGTNRYYELNPKWLLKISGSATYSKADTDSRGGFRGDSLGTYTRTKLLQFGSTLETSTNFFEEIQFGLRTDFRDRFDNTLGNANFSSKTYSASTKIQKNFTYFQNQSGVYLTYNEGKSTDFNSRFKENLIALYSLLSLEAKNWKPSLSLRGDFTNSNQYISSSAQLSRFFLEKNIELFALSKVNQKIPTLYQLYSHYGNQRLRSEKFIGHELGLHLAVPYGKIKISAFSNKTTNLIDYDFLLSKYQNIGRSGAIGIELAAAFKLSSLISNETSLTYMHARDLNTKINLIRRPRLYGKTGIKFHLFSNLDTKTQLSYQGSRTDYHSTLFTIQKMPSYITLDQSANWRLSPNWRLELETKNLLNRKYQEISGYGTLGRSVLLTLESRFL